MGVDYYTCANCARNFPDCGDYFDCITCENVFCSNKCGKKIVETDVEDGCYKEKISCLLCREEVISDNNLMQFLLNHCNLTYEQAVELYKNKLKGAKYDSDLWICR
jgi:hypothetical protein